MKSSIIPAILILLLCGCVSAQERAARQEQQEAAIEEKKARYCANIGAPYGTPKYYDCRKWIEQELAAERAQQNQALIAALPYLQQQQPAPQPQYVPMQVPNLMPHTTNCDSRLSGGLIHTTCY